MIAEETKNALKGLFEFVRFWFKMILKTPEFSSTWSASLIENILHGYLYNCIIARGKISNL